MFKKLVSKVVGDPNQKYLEGLRPIVSQINDLESAFEALSAEQLRQLTAELREKLAADESLEDNLPRAFALVREASRRTTGLRHYDVQLMGGVLLHRGEVVEMRTGEGKTLVATLPLYLNALTGRGAHLVTVNDYLARRDGGWMGKIFHLLGLTVAVIGPQQFSALYDPDYVYPGAELEDERLVHWRPCTRAEAYRADITYGISSEFGFDYLRDNMANRPEQLVQRELHFAIIDEVDNILIDEARTPLIISGPAGLASGDYLRFAGYVRGLRPNTAGEEEEPNGHYGLDEKSRSISLTALGIAEIERRVPEIDVEAGHSLYDPRFFHLTYYLDNALKAQYLFHRDKEYVVAGSPAGGQEVVIVDDFTGRLMPGRRYSDGLHEAIEAKEGVQVRRENVTVATITLQNYFRLYDKLAGMTGTAMTDAEEFGDIYKLDVTPLPTNVEYIVQNDLMGLEERRHKQDGAEEVYYVRPEQPDQRVFARRIDYADQVYGTPEAKDEAIVNEIVRVRESGRPVLVGTTSVEHSEKIHRLLEKRKVPHAVLNAKLHQSEALVVAQAGRSGAVTISTNMAGRGTDILLGGNPEGLAAEALEKELFDRQELAQLAYTLVSAGEEAAREQARKHPRLGEDLVGALQAARQDYEQAWAEIEQVQVIGYLARALQEPYAIDYNALLQALRLLRAGFLAEARDYVAGLGKDVALVDEAVRQWGLHSRYQSARSDPRQTAQFLAEVVFDTVYTARAAVIRALMADRPEEAEGLAQAVAGLTPAVPERVLAIMRQSGQERRQVWELGGLHVVGSERHESRRIDNQLRGRAARQGDPGSSRFFLSLEDDLMRRFGGERLKGFMARTNIPDDMPIESGLLDRIIESSQERIEGYNFDIRKNVVEYDDVMSKQRQTIYSERRAILLGEEGNLDERVDVAFEAAVADLIHNYLENYIPFVQAEVSRAVTDFSTEATDSINVAGVLVRLRGLLPGVIGLDRADLAEAPADRLERRLMALAHENLEQGINLYQFLQAVSRFIPLLPAVANLGAALAGRRSGQLAARDNLRRDFLAQVEAVYNDFLAEHIEEGERGASWQRAAERISQAFANFSPETAASKNAEQHQTQFRAAVEEALRDLLAESLASLEGDQMAEALIDYVAKQRERWRAQIGEEEFKNFQRLLLLDAIDREWRDYLIAMDDLRREIGLEAIGQRDPKVEYKRRSFQMFADMRGNINRAVAENYFLRVASHQAFVRQQEAAAAYQAQLSQAGYQVVQKEKGKGSELRRDTPKVGRNDPCPCGSGKKYKHCHLRADLKAAGGKQPQRVKSR
ncbi:MAG: preprotein translocase subunit SecA [Candidatus Promineifilaceae bacterium]